ncbi:hypoxanthine phosphoribosyltransferase [Leptospira wolffii serovar Khorat str. Khorat-H2]|nr:hypoxanthine phosphoribosyltransferase [Leptospira wolffii serovar Khorat str. Khorat-H2]
MGTIARSIDSVLDSMKDSSLDPSSFPVLFSPEQIRLRVKELGEAIGRDYSGKNPLFVCVLRGSVYFFSDLTRSVPYPIELDFIQAKSYEGTESTGIVKLTKDLDSELQGRHVILVEDIVDTGRTLQVLIAHVQSKKPSSLEVASLLFKEGGEACGYPVKYVGWKIGKEFVIGYGLDYDGRYRNLPGVYLFQ